MEGVLSGLRSKSTAWKTLVLALVGVLLIGWLFNTPAGLLGKADAIGYAVCHRIDLRSFHFGDRQLPLCARCTGMHLGALLGLVYQGVFGQRKAGLPPRRILAILGLLAGAFAVDGTNSFLSLIPGAPSLYTPQNWLRLVTGTGMGLVIAALLFPAFNQTAWRDWQPQPFLNGLKPLAGLAFIALFLDLVLLNGNPLLLYPLALLSAAGVLVELSLVYAMIAMMILRGENRYLRFIEMILPLAGGFGLGLLQIAFLDFIRYLLTGTWDGFHLG
jgi:uncharacterized membrane protein